MKSEPQSHFQTHRRAILSGALALAVLRREAEAQVVQSAARPEKAYGLDPQLVYLNHASIGTVPREVHRAHVAYLAQCERNPWHYVWGDEWAELVDGLHQEAASFLGAEPDDVAWTGNTTRIFGLIANGLEGWNQDGLDEVLMPSWNHVGASGSFEAAAPFRGFRVRRFDFPEADVPGLSQEDVVELYLAALGERTRVLILPHIDNVLGLRHPVARIARAARERGVQWIGVDAAQTVGMIPVNSGELGVDWIGTSAHKWLQAPKGTGLLVVSPALRESLRPLVATWGARRWQGTARAYTDFGARELPAILAAGAALRFQASLEGAHEKRERLFDYARGRCQAQASLSWRSPESYQHSGALFALGLEQGSAREVGERLYQERGIVLRAFEGGGRNHLRISPNVGQSEADLDRLFDAMEAWI